MLQLKLTGSTKCALLPNLSAVDLHCKYLFWVSAMILQKGALLSSAPWTWNLTWALTQFNPRAARAGRNAWMLTQHTVRKTAAATQQQARAEVWRGTRCCLVPGKEIKGVATSFRLNPPPTPPLRDAAHVPAAEVPRWTQYSGTMCAGIIRYAAVVCSCKRAIAVGLGTNGEV